MKKTTLLFITCVLVWFSCSESNDENPSSNGIYLLSMSNNSNERHVKITNLESGKSISLDINCPIGYGYVYHSQKNAVGFITYGSDIFGGDTFNLLDIESGSLLTSFSLPPTLFTNFVVDEANDILIGTSAEIAPTNQKIQRLVSFDLNTGEIIKSLELVDYEGFYSASSFYNPSNNSFNVMSSSGLISINIDMGEMIFSTPLNIFGDIGAFNSSLNIYYILGVDQFWKNPSLTSVNALNGAIISQIDINTNNEGWLRAPALYSVQSNLLHVVNGKGQLISINVDSGEVTDSRELEENYLRLLLFEK
jgi:hypothetical protein